MNLGSVEAPTAPVTTTLAARGRVPARVLAIPVRVPMVPVHGAPVHGVPANEGLANEPRVNAVPGPAASAAATKLAGTAGDPARASRHDGRIVARVVRGARVVMALVAMALVADAAETLHATPRGEARVTGEQQAVMERLAGALRRREGTGARPGEARAGLARLLGARRIGAGRLGTELGARVLRATARPVGAVDRRLVAARMTSVCGRGMDGPREEITRRATLVTMPVAIERSTPVRFARITRIRRSPSR